MPNYKIYNGAMPTTAKFVAVTTGTAIKTLLQVKATVTLKVVAWGVSYSGFAAATGIPTELIDTGAINATVTAHVAAGLVKMGGSDPAAGDTAGITLGTAATGYTGSAEGTITATKMFDAQLVAPTNQYIYQFPLGLEPVLVIGNVLRIRTHAAAAVDAICWVEVAT